MEEWKTYKLSSIADLSTGFPFDGHKYSSIGTRVLRGENIGDKCFNWDERRDKRWNEEFERVDEFSLRPGDIVLQMDGNVGRNKARISNEDCPMLIAQRVACLRAKENISQAFLYYIVVGKSFKDYLDSVKTGTSIQHISLKQIGDFEVTIPSSYSEQQRIADVLQALDEKIELNTRINHNLEEQAQALYKSWFVDFEPFKDGKFVESELGMIPEGWRVGQLSEIAKITMGQSPSGTSFNEDGNGIVFYQGRTEFGFRFPSIRLFTTEPTRYAEPDSVLLSVRAPVGDVNIASQRCCIGRGLASIESISGNSSFILYTILSLRSTLDRYNGEGTVFGSVNRKELESLSVIIPPENIQNRFEQIASTLDEEIKSKSKELNQLSESRDSLLPRLMSGEITC